MKTSKRILCMLLAVVMTLSMGTVALAASTYASEIWLDASTLSLYKGQAKTLTATISPSDYSGDVKWTSDNENIIVKPDTSDPKKATVTVKDTAAANQTATITVAVTKDSANALLAANCRVTVALDGVETVEITKDGVAVDDDEYIYIPRDGSVTLDTELESLSGEDIEPTITWKTGSSRIANYSTDGTISYVSDGITTVTVTATGADGKAQTDTVDLIVGKPTSITVNGPKSGADTDSETQGSLASGSSHTFTVTTVPAAFADHVTWSVSGGVGSIDARTGKFTTKETDSGTATVKATIAGSKQSATFKVNVSKLEATGIVLDDESITLGIGGSKTLDYEVSPKGASGYTLVWKVVTGDCVTVDQNGKVTATKAGTASVSVTLKDSTGSEKSTDFCQVTVQNATYNTSVDAKVGTNKSLGLASTIASQFKSKTGCTSNPTTIAIDDISGTNATLLYTSSSSSAGAAAEKTYTYSEFGSLYLRPKTTGTYYVDYTATNGNYKMTGTITIKVSSNTKNIYIELDSGDEDYVFTSDKNSDDTPAYEIIADTIGSTFSYIMFGDIDSWYDEEVGTLYASSSSSARDVEDDGKEYLNKSSGTYTIRKLCFSPNGDEGTFAIEYTAYNSYDEAVATGTLFIIVGEGADDGVTVTLDNADDTYYFDEDTEEEDDNAYDMLYDYIEDEYYKDYDSDTEDLYIKFYEFVEADPGVLYDGDDNEVEEDDDYQLYELEDFYFEPSEDGTFEVELDVYDSSRMNTSNFVGTVMLYIVVGEGSDSDVVVTLDDGKAYTFDDDTDKDDDSAYDMIVDYLDDATSKTVSYIRFGAVSSGSTVGALYPTASSTAKVTTSTKFYLSTLSLSNYSLEDVTFKPAKAGTFEIPFTAYTSANAVAATGTLTIKVPGGSGSSVEEVGDVIVYLDSDADDYYFDDDDEEGNTAYDLIIDYIYDEFDIDLEDDDAYIMFYDVENDEAGTLYANDDEDDLDDEEEYYDTDIDEFYFVVDGDGSYEAEFDVYLWDDDDDEYLYEDSFVLQIIVGDGTAVSTAKNFTSYSNGYTFKTSDFYSTLDTSSVVSVVFDKPSSGRLYVNYANGSGTAVTTNTKFYTTLSSYGTYPISSLTYIPKAGFSGNATITYVATTLAGKTVTGTITMSVKTKTASSKFSDVTASNVGTWAADSVDFASSWGLVNGTTTTAPYKFSPNANMKRCDLLLILYRAAGSPSVTGTITHSDVPSSAYYYKAAVWAYKNGIVSNIVTSAYTFAPNTAVTREEFATILYNYTKYTGVSVTNSGSLANYTDVSSVSSYAKDAMTWAVSKGYITSMSTTSLVLSPKTQATRAQIATLLHRYLTY